MKIPHNSVKWQVMRNKPPAKGAHVSGWIDGPDEDVIWREGSELTFAKAVALVEEHNAWLEQQKPISLRLIDAQQRVAAALAEHETQKVRLQRTAEAYKLALEEFSKLQREAAGQAETVD